MNTGWRVDYRRFGRNVRAARLGAELTQCELAQRLRRRGYRISQTGLSLCENGHHYPARRGAPKLTVDLVLGMSDVLRCRPELLLDGVRRDG